jgi:hypothetical protein
MGLDNHCYIIFCLLFLLCHIAAVLDSLLIVGALSNPAYSVYCAQQLSEPSLLLLLLLPLQVMPQLLSFMELDAEDPHAPDW